MKKSRSINTSNEDDLKDALQKLETALQAKISLQQLIERLTEERNGLYRENESLKTSSLELQKANSEGQDVMSRLRQDALV